MPRHSGNTQPKRVAKKAQPSAQSEPQEEPTRSATQPKKVKEARTSAASRTTSPQKAAGRTSTKATK